MTGRRILKWKVSPAERSEIRTADEPTWLSVGAQGTDIVAWCEATPGEGVTTILLAQMTGGPAQLSETSWARFIGTATQADGIVVHVYHGPSFKDAT